MTAAAAATAPPKPVAIGAGVVGLLTLAIFINYVDRGNLATATPLLKDELKLNNTQVGWLLSAFFWSYTPAQILAGWLTERINAYRTLALGLALWALATMGMGLATGFVALFLLRVLLGIGESAAFPCSSKLLARHLPPHRLGGANGLMGAGLALGPAFGTLVGGLLMARVGWRPVFLLFGLVSLLWLWPWLRATRRASALERGEPDGPAPPIAAILRQPALWGASLGHFTANYSLYFVLSWLPLYLVKARGFSVPEMATLGGLLYVVNAGCATFAGWASDRWIGSGASVNLVRKSIALSAHAVVAVSMLVCAFGDRTTSVVCLFVAAAAFGFNSPCIFSIGQTLAGPRAAGKWIGVQNCLGNFAGILCPIITGMVVDRTGQFFWAFVICSAMAVTGMVGWGVIIRKVEAVQWGPVGAAA